MPEATDIALQPKALFDPESGSTGLARRNSQIHRAHFLAGRISPICLDIELNSLSSNKTVESGALKRVQMNKNIALAIVPFQEAIAFCVVEIQNSSENHGKTLLVV